MGGKIVDSLDKERYLGIIISSDIKSNKAGQKSGVYCQQGTWNEPNDISNVYI